MSILREVTIKAERELKTDEILVFVGARQVGKTTILHQLEERIKAKEKFFINLEDKDVLTFLNQSPKNIFQIVPINLKQKTYLFLDEVQYLDDPSHFLKYLYDQYKGKIKLIVSGSSAFYLDKKFKDSLAGRKKIFYVYPLNKKEYFRFLGKEELGKKSFSKLTLFEKDEYKRLIYQYLVFGGYPRVVLAEIGEKKEVLRELVYSYIKKDIYESKVRQEDVFYRLLKILASQIGSLVNEFELARILGVSKTSIDNYLYIMQKSFHIVLIKPFYKNIRKEITKMPKVYFYDLGIRNFLVNNFDAYLYRFDKGQILENYFFIRLLEKYYPEEIHFWRKVDGGEIDFLVEDKAYEVKVNKSLFKKSKYSFFIKKYPWVKFEVVDEEEIIFKK